MQRFSELPPAPELVLRRREILRPHNPRAQDDGELSRGSLEGARAPEWEPKMPG